MTSGDGYCTGNCENRQNRCLLMFILSSFGNKNRTAEVFRVAAYLTRRYL